MLTAAFKRQRGVSLIELMVGIVLVAIMITYGASSFKAWIQNSQIRATAESIQNGLQLARAEAVRQNKSVRFQLTSNVTNACQLSTTEASWAVSELDVTDACASTPSNVAAPPDPRIVQVRNASEASNAEIAADKDTVVFNSLGRVTPTPTANIKIDVRNSIGGACAPAGPMRCLRVVVAIGGQIRMCDPAVSVATDSRVCP